MEVMGVMVGEFVDEYTVRVVDVFAMPQNGTGVSVEAVDHVLQTNMLNMLKRTGRLCSFINCFLYQSNKRLVDFSKYITHFLNFIDI